MPAPRAHSRRFALPPPLVLVLLVLPLGACRDGRRKTSPAKTVAKVEQRQQRVIVHDLLEEVSRAELSQHGLLVSLGTPDQHKYTHGGWETGWRDAGADGKALFARSNRYARLLVLLAQERTTAVVLRVRSSRPGQKVTVRLAGRDLGTRPVKAAWQTLVFPMDPPGPPGRQVLSLDFDRPDRLREHAADVEWVWFRDGPLPEGPPDPGSLAKVGRVELDHPAMALLADPPRALSFYYPIEEGMVLEADLGAEQPLEMEVCVHADGMKPSCPLRRRAEAGRWTPVHIPLSEWAGRVVRLDLTARGRGGKAGWANAVMVRQAAASRTPVVTPQNRAKNLIYILVDTARQDVYSVFNPTTRVSAPAMERFAKDAVLFENAYNHDNWTKPSVATALTGMYSSSHGMSDNDTTLPSEVRLVSEHLKERGFETAGFIANAFVSEKYGFKRGWDTYRNYVREGKEFDSEFVYADAISWLKKPRDGRFFLYIQTFDPHVPYAVADKYLSLYYKGKYRGKLGPMVTHADTWDFIQGKRAFTEDDKRYIHALYDGEITYHDDQFALFMKEVERLGLLDQTLVVVSNDHGEEMFDHDSVGHWHTLYEELLRNPLVMRYPGLLPPGRRVKTLVGLVDVVPTMLDLLGVQPMPQAEGVSLLGTIYDRRYPWDFYEVAEHAEHYRAVRLGNQKLIHKTMHSWLFDLDRDPGEHTNLASGGSRDIVHRACDVYLGEGLAVPHRRRRLQALTGRTTYTSTKVKMDPELSKQLEALGYVTGPGL